MILRPGSSETNRRPNSRRCLRFSRPLVSRSNVDFLRLAISCSCGLKSTKVRLGLPKTTDSPTGSGPHLLQGGPATNQYIAAAEVMLNDGHKGTKQMSTIACPPRSTPISSPPSVGAGTTEKFLVQFIAPQAREG